MLGRCRGGLGAWLLGLAALAGGCGPLGYVETGDRRSAAVDVRDATAAWTDGTGLCAAVWVAPAKLFTAAHCVGEGGVGVAETPSGGRVTVVVLAVHDRIDLAVLEAVGRLPAHAVAEPGPTPRYADRVLVVGHPQGLGWSVAEGLVTGTRTYDGAHWLQASAPVWFGNSGGGLFDTHGRLVGITSHGHALPFAQHLGAYVHPGYLRAAYRHYVAGR